MNFNKIINVLNLINQNINTLILQPMKKEFNNCINFIKSVYQEITLKDVIACALIIFTLSMAANVYDSHQKYKQEAIDIKNYRDSMFLKMDIYEKYLDSSIRVKDSIKKANGLK
jgi:hypothetical protein